MYEYNLARYNADRSYYRHTTEMKTSLCGDDDDGDDSKSIMLQKYGPELSVTLDVFQNSFGLKKLITQILLGS